MTTLNSMIRLNQKSFAFGQNIFREHLYAEKTSTPRRSSTHLQRPSELKAMTPNCQYAKKHERVRSSNCIYLFIYLFIHSFIYLAMSVPCRSSQARDKTHTTAATQTTAVTTPDP